MSVVIMSVCHLCGAVCVICFLCACVEAAADVTVHSCCAFFVPPFFFFPRSVCFLFEHVEAVSDPFAQLRAPETIRSGVEVCVLIDGHGGRSCVVCRSVFACSI